MLTVLLTPERSRRLTLFSRRDYRVHIPGSWIETPAARRLQWWKWSVQCPPAQAQELALHDCLRRVPRRLRRRLPAEDVACMIEALRWLPSQPGCVDIPLPVATVRRVRFRWSWPFVVVTSMEYHMAKPKGQNVTCSEFAVCDDLYKLVANKNDTAALEMLTAVLYRERDPNEADAAARGDVRVPYRNKDEATRRLATMGTPSAEMQFAALMYFAGLKTYIHRLYGQYIFEDTGDEESDEPTPRQQGPEFGWWGTLQQVAEGGTFGKLAEVYQAYLHEVCVYLVRKRQEADALRAQHEQLKMKD